MSDLDSSVASSIAKAETSDAKPSVMPAGNHESAAAAASTSQAISPSAAKGGPLLHHYHSHNNSTSSSPPNKAANRSQDEQPAPKPRQQPLSMDDAAMDNRIVVALESDNKRLLDENRQLRRQIKELKEQLELAASGRPVAASSGVKGASGTGINANVFPLDQPPPPHIAAARQLLEQTEVTALREKVKRMEAQHSEELKDMARKIAWYVDHQEFNKAQDQLVEEQQKTIHDLRLRLLDAEGKIPASIGGKPGAAMAEKERVIKSLQRRIIDLEEQVTRTGPSAQNPATLTDMIRACRPSVSETQQFKELQRQNAELQKALVERDEQHTKAIEKLRIASDAVKVQYQAKLEKVEEEMKQRLQATTSRKVRELERQLQETRRFYSERLREVEHANVALRRGLKADGAPHAFAAVGAVSSSASASHKLGKKPSSSAASKGKPALTATGEHGGGDGEDKEKKQLPQSQSHHEHEADLLTKNNENHAAAPVDPSAVLAENYQLRQALFSAEQHIHHLRSQLQQSSRFVAGMAMPQASSSPAAAGASDTVLVSLQQQLGSHQEIAVMNRLIREGQESLRKAHVDWEDRVYHLRAAHEKAIIDLKTAHKAELDQMREKYDAQLQVVSSAQRLRSTLLFDNQQQLQKPSDIATGNNAVGNGDVKNMFGDDVSKVLMDTDDEVIGDADNVNQPSSNKKRKGCRCNAVSLEVKKYITLVADRLEQLEMKAAEKELEQERTLNEVKKVAAFEIKMEQEKAALLLQQKNHQITEFKQQLDSLLSDLAQLQIAQQSVPPVR